MVECGGDGDEKILLDFLQNNNHLTLTSIWLTSLFRSSQVALATIVS